MAFSQMITLLNLDQAGVPSGLFQSSSRLALGLALGLGVCAAVTSMSGCDQPTDSSPPTEKVVVAGKTFQLERALNDETRFKGLSGRTEIKPDGGMIFAFPKPNDLQFVMRDCPVPIDIIYLDAAGRVTAAHKMVAEPPRAEDEKELKPPQGFPNAPKWTWTNEKYENRLKKYPSRFPAQYVIELKGNTLDEIKVKEGDKVEFDKDGLKKQAQ